MTMKTSQPVDIRDFVFLWDEELDFLSIYWIPYIINDTRVLTNSVISLGLPNDPQNHLCNLLTSILPSVKTGLQRYSGTSYSMGGESDEDTWPFRVHIVNVPLFLHFGFFLNFKTYGVVFLFSK